MRMIMANLGYGYHSSGYGLRNMMGMAQDFDHTRPERVEIGGTKLEKPHQQ